MRASLPRLALWALSTAALPLGAQPVARGDLPRALQDWAAWALDGADERVCPVVGEQAVCLWPGRVRLEAGATGARFTLEAHAERALDLALPGGARRWPEDVRLDGQPAVVLAREGLPVVRLSPGAHRLEGRFTWERLPDSLAVPNAFALVDLSVDGRSVALPRRDESGLLLLRQAGADTTGGDELRLQVFRRVADGIPVWVESRLAFDVSGRAREVALQHALPPDCVAVAVTGDLPARLDDDGTLRVQVRAGTFGVTLLARARAKAETLAAPEAPVPWPGQEVWVFAADERLRQVALRGATPVDPSRTDLPAEWRALPAFALQPKETLTLHELQRGEPQAAPDELSLLRRLWLDQSGRGFSARDELRGTLRRTSRVELLAPGELGRVELDSEGQLITRAAGSQGSGVELRRATLALVADSYLPETRLLPAVGWNVNVQSLALELQLPPGWRLLAATGADHVTGAWSARFGLWAIFFVVLVALLLQRLLGTRYGLMGLVALLLLEGEPGAPRFAWLFLLAALALVRAAPEGRLNRLARAAFTLGAGWLLAVLLPFGIAQVRSALHPQVEALDAPLSAERLGALEDSAPAAPPPPPAAATPQSEGDGLAGKANEQPMQAPQRQSNVLSYDLQARRKAYALDPHAVVQTGAGVPQWTWSGARLTWSGPVSQDQRVRLFLLSPAFNLLLTLLRVGLALLLALRLLATRWPRLGQRLPWLGGPPAAPAAQPPDEPPAGGPLVATALVLGLCWGAPLARAQEEADTTAPAPRAGLLPSDELLGELRARLLRAPACAPSCVSTARLQLFVDGADLRLLAEVHAGASAAWPLPGPAESWVPRAVTLDGRPAEGRLARLANGFLHLRVEPGLHRVELRGPLPPKDSLTLQFGEAPRRASASAPGWQVDGIREDGSADDSVQLTRRLPRASGAQAVNAGGYEPWLEVTRVLDLGVSWSVETIVRRISPTGVPVVVKVPLLKGMLVTDREREVQDGEVRVSLGRDQIEARWFASLPASEGTVTLVAPEGRPWSEVWQLRCGPVWQCEALGLAPVSRWVDGQLAPEFRPWPGERLALTFHRPQGIAGRSLTLDSVALAVKPGLRLEDATLTLQARASRPTPLTLLLPEGAEVQSLRVGDRERPIRPEGRKLTIALEAGQQPLTLTWRRAGGLGLWHRAAPLELGAPAVNVSISIQMPPERLLLFTGGPAWGPAVLFWPYLICFVVAAALLARLPGSPLGFGAWAVLGIGLSQIPLPAALIVVGWFAALAWRRGRVLASAWRHDLLQLALAFLTLLALGCLYGAVHQGLLLRPDMQVAGGGSSETLLRWYQDRVDGALPRPFVVSLPLGYYRLLMLAWSLWLALGLVRYLRWAWECFSSGALWRPLRAPRPTAPVA